MKTAFIRAAAMACGIAAATGLPATGAFAQQSNCIDALAGMQNYSRMVNATVMGSMANEVRALNNITVFAPTNEAINRVDQNLANRIFPRDESGARNADPVLASAAIRAHIVQGRIPASALVEGMRLTTMAGNTITVHKQGGATTVSAAENVTANITQPDMGCANGVIHGIDHVLIR
jgi:uncharacterized surface protein with fasciclin (FAS1) repeats